MVEHDAGLEPKGIVNKCYALIERFSEDLDIVISAKVIGMDSLAKWR